MKRTTRPHCPYKILPVELPESEVHPPRDPWRVLEFFRVEALLRSRTVMQLYKTTFSTDDINKPLKDKLILNHQVWGGWLVLKGMHHRFIFPDLDTKLSGTIVEKSGILDLRALITTPPGGKDQNSVLNWLKREIPKGDGRYVWLRIDAAAPPHSIFKELGKMLKSTCREVNVDTIPPCNLAILSDSEYVTFMPHHPRKKPLIRDLKTWLDYFKCYDLREFKGLPFGQIAKQVYGQTGPQARDRAETVFRRASHLIRAAEQNDWPPTRVLVLPPD